MASKSKRPKISNTMLQPKSDEIHQKQKASSSSIKESIQRWREIPYSEILKVALTYKNKLVPSEWKFMTNPRLIGTCMRFFSKSQVSEVWDIIYKPSQNNDPQMTIWNPHMYKDYDIKLYNRYFPIVLEKSSLKVLAYDYQNNLDVDEINNKVPRKEGWIILPSLDWIKSQIYTRIIAANDGLIVLDSTKPAISRIQINYKWIYHENQNYADNVHDKNQSLLTVINPLTREYLFLPPIPFNDLFDKIGYLSFSNAKERHYRLFVLGWSKIDRDFVEKKDALLEKQYYHMVYLAIYDSPSKDWIYFDSFEDAKINFPYLGGRGSCAVINYGLYFGGTKVNPQGSKEIHLETPCIFYVNCSTSRQQHLSQPFLLHGIANIIIPEPPKVLRIANNKIYAVTRETAKFAKKCQNQLVLVEILLNEDGTPNGQYASVENGVMPEVYVNKLFLKPPTRSHRKVNNLAYEVSSCGDLIAFRVSLPLFVLYDVHKSNWRLTYYENDPKAGSKTNYILFE
ncbi:hypothetical protein KC19_6G088900, partial [Ceratodon purpureus]